MLEEWNVGRMRYGEMVKWVIVNIHIDEEVKDHNK